MVPAFNQADSRAELSFTVLASELMAVPCSIKCVTASKITTTFAIFSLLSPTALYAFQFSSPTYTVNERDDFVNVCFEANFSELSDNDTEQAVAVNVYTNSESAGKHYMYTCS